MHRNRSLPLAKAVLICALLLAACATTAIPFPSAQPDIAGTAAPTDENPSDTPVFTELNLSPVDPDAVAGQLTPAASLEEAAGQLAGVLAVSPDAVTVQVRTSSCLCSAGSDSEFEELTLAEASDHQVGFGSFWLRAQGLSCFYSSDGESLVPQACHRVIP